MAVVDALQVEVESDVPFGRGGERELLCDIYRPSPTRPTKQTAVINLHGGGFRGGSKAGTRVARPLASLGYTCISSSYRVLPEATWPSQLHDVKTVIRWTRAHASSLGIQPDRIVVLGYSAGGRLALLAAGTQNDAALEGDGGDAGAGTRVAACVSFYAPVASRNNPVLGPDPSEELRRSYLPLEQIKPGYPPTLLLHGTDDKTVSVDDAVTLYNALRAAQVPVELHVVEGVTHIFDAHADLAQASAEWIDLFLDRHVANSRRYASTEPPAR